MTYENYSYTSYIEVVKLLLNDPLVDPSAYNNHAIRWASENGYTEIVKLLLNDPRVDPSDNDNHAIQLASKMGHTEVVRILLRASFGPRVDPSANNNCAIRWSCLQGHAEIVKLLLNDPRVKPNNWDIKRACKNGHTEVVKLLLQTPCCLNDSWVDPSDDDNFAMRKTKSMVIMEMLLEKIPLFANIKIRKYRKYLIRKKYLLKLLSTKVYDYSKLF